MSLKKQQLAFHNRIINFYVVISKEVSKNRSNKDENNKAPDWQTQRTRGVKEALASKQDKETPKLQPDSDNSLTLITRHTEEPFTFLSLK